MKRKRGFTLIELLVVIAIIALLMSILMPALSKVRQAAKDAACAMNARQWGVIFNMYTSDNDSYFTDGCVGVGPSGIGDWMTAMWDDYISKDPTDSYVLDGYEPGWGCPAQYRAWGGGLGYETMERYIEDAPDTVGSYAFNAWCNNYPRTAAPRWLYDTDFCWRNTSVSGASNVPVLPDSLRWGCNPQADDTPAEYDGGGGGMTDNEMRRVCLDRHGGAINILFMDWSSRRVGLKDLWGIETKWHRNWTKEWEDEDVAGMDWPKWMRNF